MEAYGEYLMSTIAEHWCEATNLGLGTESSIENRNEEGRLHSVYLGDRYEPAVEYKCCSHIFKYYLFDGNIKDCEHPFCIVYKDGKIIEVTYYSTRRIIDGEQIKMGIKYAYYNFVSDGIVVTEIMEEYESKISRDSNLSSFSEVCDEIDAPLFKFKFAD